jgi:hypothetical protein
MQRSSSKGWFQALQDCVEISLLRVPVAAARSRSKPSGVCACRSATDLATSVQIA